MGKKASSPPKPKDPLKIAPEQSQRLLSYYRGQLPDWIALQEQFGPQFMAQMLGQTGQFLEGVGGQPGLQALQLSTAQQQALQILNQQQRALWGEMTGRAFTQWVQPPMPQRPRRNRTAPPANPGHRTDQARSPASARLARWRLPALPERAGADAPRETAGRRVACPRCGGGTLMFQEGCASCLSCGYSKCS